jgi:chemotaxis protein MotB
MHHLENTRDLALFEDQGSALDRNPLTAWVLPWADLMMIMFVLFVALFIYASNKKDAAPLFLAPARAAAPEQGGVLGSIEEFLQIFAGRGLTPGANLRAYERTREIIYKSDPKGVSVSLEADGGMRMVLRGDVAFAPGRAELSPESQLFLKEAAGVLAVSPNTVHVVGHAEDGEARPGEDLRLSAQRAASVAEFLARAGIEQRRLAVTGLGASRPEAAPITEAEQHKNRRVEIVLLTGVEPAP